MVRIFAVLVVLCAGACVSQSAGAQKQETERTATMQVPIETLQNVLSAFSSTTGSIAVVESQLTDVKQQVPYLAPEAVTRIRIQPGPLIVTNGTKLATNSFVQAWDLFYSPMSHQVIKAVSVWPVGVSGKPFPSINVQEKEMKKVGQTFVGIPAASPKIKLMDAINRAVCAPGAKQIVAYYVLDSYVDLRSGKKVIDSRPVWVIHAWGFPPFMPTSLPRGASPDSVPEDFRNHMRSIIDAETGHFYGADTIPQPELAN